MDVNEILLRTVRGHWRLLLVCLLLPPFVVGALALVTPTTYTSWARLQGGTVLPGSETEADAMLNVVKGVATSPEMVRRAVEEVGVVGRDPIKTAAKIDVTRLGSAAVFDMSVTDVDPKIATALTQALATDVVGYLNNAGDARTANLLGGLGDRQKELLVQRQKIAAMLTLTKDPVGSADLAAQLSGIDQQLADLSSTMRQLQLGGTSAAGSAGSAALISPAVSTGRTPTNLLTDLGLALVVGLIVGLLAATILEVLRPRVPDARMFAREIGAPMLGQLVGARDGATKDGLVPDRETGLALCRAAAHAEVSQVLLVGPRSADRQAAIAADLQQLVAPKQVTEPPSPHRLSPPRQLAENGRAEPGQVSTTTVLDPSADLTTGPARQPLEVRALAELDPDGVAEHVGVVPIVPRFVPYSELRRIEDLAAAAGWPVIGVIGDPRSAPRSSRSDRSGRA